MRDEFLNLIEELETQANNRIAEAKIEAEEIRQQAGRDAAEIVQEARRGRRSVADIQQDSDRITDAGTADEAAVEEYRKAALARRPEAVKQILAALEA